MKLLKSSFSVLQQIGKSLMLPVSVLPVAGILLGVGSAEFPWLPELVSQIMAQSGGVIFGNLPIIFAVGTALGLARNDGVAALAAVVGYVVMLATMGVFSKHLGYDVELQFGIESINTGVFGSIWIGLLAAILFNRYYRINLPAYLAFFAGKRFVPIVTALAGVASGLVLSVLWPPIGGVIDSFSYWAASESPEIAFSLYGFIERLLIPFGLHHIWNVPFFFQSGEFIHPVTGQVLTGEIARYIAGDPSAGNLAGGYLFKMFGLPAAAIAIWHTAQPEHRLRVSGIMLSAALTSFLTGITEPIEFSFLFLAPLLYLTHAVFCAFAYFICIVLEVKHGMTFSHGLIDFIILFPQSSNAWLFAVLGPVWAGLYYGVFKLMIKKFDLKTPGRELPTESILGEAPGEIEKSAALVAAFGGPDNIENLDACITRLRVQVADSSRVEKERLKDLGASGVLMVGNSIQAIFGPPSENLKTDMEQHLKSLGGAETSARVPAPKSSRDEVQSTAHTISEKELNQVVEGLGGRSNIRSIEAVAWTRIRVELRDSKLLNEKLLRAAGVSGVQTLADGVFHLLVGERAQRLGEYLKNRL